jgi:hypothetical protein
LAGLLLASSGFMAGCGALFDIGGSDSSAIAFATGELRATEEFPLVEVDDACRRAIETLGYEEVQIIRGADELRWRATTPGGDPVDIHLMARGADRTEVRIRIGVSGNEGRSRLVLEQIRQSLGPSP